MTTPLVPLIPRTTLFVRGMAAQCPALDVIIAGIADQAPDTRLKCFRILERLLRTMPGLPRLPDGTAEPLRDLTPFAVSRLAEGQDDPVSQKLHQIWHPLWTEFDQEVSEFARRSVVLLIELFRLSARLSTAKAS